MMADNTLEDDTEDVREVYEYFGRAAFEAQCLEKQIAIVLSYMCAGNHEEITTLRHDELLETNLDHTFGALVRELTMHLSLPTDVRDKLARAVEGRNWLSHNYWWDRASEFASQTGRQDMLTELNSLVGLFSELDRFLTQMFKEWAHTKGVTEDDFGESLNELLSGPTPPRRKRRLGKTETLIAVYLYPTDKFYTNLFELGDHSYWSLCESGLTFGPEQLDHSRLIPMAQLQGLLPATFVPKPKGAKGWHYRLVLSTGVCIEISPSTRRPNAFRWKLLSTPSDPT